MASLIWYHVYFPISNSNEYPTFMLLTWFTFKQIFNYRRLDLCCFLSYMEMPVNDPLGWISKKKMQRYFKGTVCRSFEPANLWACFCLFLSTSKRVEVWNLSFEYFYSAHPSVDGRYLEGCGRFPLSNHSTATAF